MANNTTLNGTTVASGPTFRDLDRAGIKTQVVQLDIGGAGVEQLVAGTVPVSGTVATSGNGAVSSVNSSSTPLGIGAVLVGASEDVTEYVDIRISVFADQASAVDGLQIQQSSNGVNWDISDNYSIPANTGKTFSVGVSGKFYRTVYTNGAVAQTAFRLLTKLHKSYSKGSSVRPQDGRTNDNDMEEQTSHLMGYNGVSWDRVRASIASGLVVDVSRVGTATPSADVTMQAAAIAVGNGTLLPVTGYGTALIQISGTFVGTVTFEGTEDGTNFVSVAATQLGASSIASTATIPAIYRLSVAGLTSLRARISAYTSGSITALGRTTNAPFTSKFIQLVAGTNTIGAVNIAAAQTLATVTTVGTVTTCSTLTTLANGQTAHSAASTGSPVRIGGRVNTAADTTLVQGDASDVFITSAGQLNTKPFGLPELDWQFAGAAGGIINTTDVVLKAAGAAGVRNYCTSISVQNSSATVATEVVVKDGVTVIWRGYVGTSAILNSAVSVSFPTPLRGTAATALNVACITTGAAVYVNAQGYQAP